MMGSRYIAYEDTAWETSVAGIPFRYDNGNRILLWKVKESDGAWPGTGSRFYELQEAYDTGLLTQEDLKSIAYYHETGKTIGY